MRNRIGETRTSPSLCKQTARVWLADNVFRSCFRIHLEFVMSRVQVNRTRRGKLPGAAFFQHDIQFNGIKPRICSRSTLWEFIESAFVTWYGLPSPWRLHAIINVRFPSGKLFSFSKRWAKLCSHFINFNREHRLVKPNYLPFLYYRPVSKQPKFYYVCSATSSIFVCVQLWLYTIMILETARRRLWWDS